MPEWLSADWFYYSTLKGYVWDNPLYLYLIGGIPILFFLRWLFYNRDSQRLGLALEKEITENRSIGWLRFVVPAVFTIGVILLLMASARPQKALQSEELITEGINIVIALDISESMMASDLKPTRLEAAKRVASKFVSGRKSDKVGLVVFAGESMSICPLTTDYGLVNNFISEVSHDMIKTSGTAIGNALASAINRLRDVPGTSKVIILLSDGDNTAGDLDPITATELAISFGIRIYTISVGKSTQLELVDERKLREIAKVGKGRFYSASNNSALENIFKQINTLETNLFQKNQIHEMRDYYYVYLNWSVVFLLLSFILKSSFLGNILED